MSDRDDSDNDPKSDSPMELTPPPVIPDYRNCKFLLQFTIYLDKDRVGGFGKMFSLEELSYSSQSEEAVQNTLTDTDIEIHLVSSIASMKAYRTQPITNDVAKAEHCCLQVIWSLDRVRKETGMDKHRMSSLMHKRFCCRTYAL